MNPLRIACWSAPATGPSGITSEPRSTSWSLISRPVMTPPLVGMVTHELRVTAATAATATSASRRIRSISLLLMAHLREGRAVVRGKVERRAEDAHPALPGKREPEAGAVAELRPYLQGALVQRCVFQRDRQAQPGAADGALTRRIGAPEPVEHAADLRFGHPDAVVANSDRRRRLVAVDCHHDRLAFPVLDGVTEKVAQDATDATRV